MNILRDIDDGVLVRACQMFLDKAKTPEIRDAVNDDLKRLGANYAVTREQVYQLLFIAIDRKIFTLYPPEHLAKGQRIADYYRLSSDCVHVGNAGTLEQLAATTARLIVDLIQELSEKKKHIHVGLGGGWTSMLVASQLATQLRGLEGDPLPELTLHALSSGFDPHRPQTAPVSFFGFFEGTGIKTNYVGLFASAVVDSDEYKSTIKSYGVKESFAEKHELDIVVTSLGSASHDHGDFNTFIRLGRASAIKSLKKAGWVGDVQYRPFSAKGPITKDEEIRAVTLLEIHELVTMAASEDKHVVVVAGPCSVCGKSRDDALLPLVAEPSLKLWSHLVMDLATANKLLEGA